MSADEGVEVTDANAAAAEAGVPEAATERHDPKFTGLGLLKGLGVTMKHMLKPAVTQQYPHEKPELPPRTRGVIALKEANCTVCYKCSRECPDWCIYIDAHKETHDPAGGGKARSAKVLDRFAIDYSLCMYCGICVEVCPFDALFWSPEFEYAEYDVHELVHEKEKLEEWVGTVPAPLGVEAGAEVPPEDEPAGVAKAADGAAGGGAPAAATVQLPGSAAPASTGPTIDTVAPAADPPPPAAAPPTTKAEPDQAVYDEVFAAELAKGTPERVAQGKAKRAAVMAARKAAVGEALAGPPPAVPPPTTPTPAAPKAEPDQATYDRVLAEELAKGTPERVAQGKAKRAAMLAARKKAEG